MSRKCTVHPAILSMAVSLSSIKSYQETPVTQVHQGLLGCQGQLDILGKQDMVFLVLQELREILGYLASQVNLEFQVKYFINSLVHYLYII